MERRISVLKKFLAQHGKRVTVFMEAGLDLPALTQVGRLRFSRTQNDYPQALALHLFSVLIRLQFLWLLG